MMTSTPNNVAQLHFFNSRTFGVVSQFAVALRRAPWMREYRHGRSTTDNYEPPINPKTNDDDGLRVL
jgi:hypothetical protein